MCQPLAGSYHINTPSALLVPEIMDKLDTARLREARGKTHKGS